MLSGILGAAFLQSAGRAGKGEPVGKIILDTLFANPRISNISCTGEIKVSSIYNGEKKVETYTDLDGETLSIQADANTKIVISGAEITYFEIGLNVDYTKVSVKNTALTEMYCANCIALTTLDVSENTALTELDCASCSALTTLNLSKNTALTSLGCSSCQMLTALDLRNNPALTYLSCNKCYALTTLDVSENTALTEFNCDMCFALTTLDVSENTALTEMSCNSCYALNALNLSKNTALTSLSCSSCAKLISISYPATDDVVSTAIAGAITNAKSADGVVYTDSDGAYYSTIATAATSKGWTIAQLPA